MTLQRLIGWVLLCIVASVFGFMSGQWWMSFVAMAISGIGAFTGLRLPLTRRWMSGLTLVLAVGLLIQGASTGSLPDTLDSPLLPIHIVVALGHVLMLVLALEFCRQSTTPVLPVWQVGLGAMILVCAGTFDGTTDNKTIYLVAVMLYVVLGAIYLDTCVQRDRPVASHKARRTLPTAGLLVLTIGLTQAGMYGMDRLRPHLDQVWTRLLLAAATPRAQRISFASHPVLGSIAGLKTNNPERIALRVYTQHGSVYLRGAVYDSFLRGEWHVGKHEHYLHRMGSRFEKTLGPMPFFPQDLPSPRVGENVFEIRPVNARHFAAMDICPDPDRGGGIFIPPGISHLQLRSNFVTVNEHGIVTEMSSETVSRDYRCYVPQVSNPEPISTLLEPMMLSSFGMSPTVRKIADEVFAGQETFDEKCQAVERYFHDNYQYSLGIQIPPRRDPLDYFFKDRPAAHCEYFATGAVILLRQAGIPCRYVTGFVTSEWNPLGEYWISRDKDAHAWAEAYDPQRGWVIVEATPSDGVPADESSYVKRVADFFKNLGEMLRHPNPDVRAQVWWGLLQSPLGWLAIAAGFAWFVWFLLRLVRWALREVAEWQRVPVDPVVHTLHRILKRMDWNASRLGFTRLPGETLNQFADRIGQVPGLEPIAAWYERYAAARYANQFDATELVALNDPPIARRIRLR